MAIFNSYVSHYQRVLGILGMCSSKVASLMSHVAQLETETAAAPLGLSLHWRQVSRP